MKILPIIICGTLVMTLSSCSGAVSIGSGIVDQHIVVYDVHNDRQFFLWDRSNYDYSLCLENNQLYAQKNIVSHQCC